MAIRPIDIQTNLSQTTQVDRMRQTQQQHMVGQQQHSDDIDKKIKKEAEAVAENEKSEAEKDIDDYESEKRRSAREQKRGEKKEGEEEEAEPQEPDEPELKDSTYHDPDVGGHLDLTG